MNPDGTLAVPMPDALPLPGPIWLFEFLLLLTFVLHILAMNFLLGGSIIAVVERLRAKAMPGRNAGAEVSAAAGEPYTIARWFETKMPVAMAFTITLGIAPLLFVQAMYGHLFYSASVITAWPWFSVLGVLLVTYSLVYRLSFNGDTLSGASKVIGLLVSIGLLTIAFLYVNNMTLSIRPDVWAAKYFARPDGTAWNTDDPTFWPRLLHFVTAAVAVAGMVLATVGAKRVTKGDETGRTWLKLGALWFVIPTFLQFAWGLWWLLALEREIMLPLMGGDMVQTIVFMTSIFLPIGAMVMMALSLKHERPFGLVHGASWLLLLTIVGMIMTRHAIREYTLNPVFDLSSVQVLPQWGVFGIFAVLLVIALATVAWMVVSMAKASGGQRA